MIARRYGFHRRSAFRDGKGMGFNGAPSRRPASWGIAMRSMRMLEAGRSLAERIPYSLLALVSRFAVASVFWRSGRTKVHGFAIKEETFVLFREEYRVPLLAPEF